MKRTRDELWRISVDVGGTFTDCIAMSPEGQAHRLKVLSSGLLRATVLEVHEQRLRIEVPYQVPEGFFLGASIALSRGPEINIKGSSSDGWLSFEVAPQIEVGEPMEIRCGLETPVLAAHLLTKTPLSEPLPPMEMRLATTRGTNALLERRGSPTALFITRGFGDLLEIGTGARSDLFAVDIVKPDQYYKEVFEIYARLDAEGRVLEAIDQANVRRLAKQALASGCKSAAVSIIHSWKNAALESEVAQILNEFDFDYVVWSSELSMDIGFLSRTQTTVADAYLAPLLASFLRTIDNSLADCSSLLVMNSAGGLETAADFKAKDSLLSGPAGGVAGMATSAQSTGIERAIGFDMGGTSSDVARWEGSIVKRYQHKVADSVVHAPAVDIHTVAAGGGSICWFDGTRLRVGPQSAGADPGPACYGAGGPLTLTDVNLLLGRLGTGKISIPISRDAAAHALEKLKGEMIAAQTEVSDDAEMLEGLLQIANEKMAEAIRVVSQRQGFDPADYALVAFGGAGGLHACEIAEELGITRVLLPPDAGILSAVGLAHSCPERVASRAILLPLSECEDQLAQILADATDEVLALLDRDFYGTQGTASTIAILEVRLLGQESSIQLPIQGTSTDRASIEDSFLEAYQRIYGYWPKEGEIEVVAARVTASASDTQVNEADRQPPSGSHTLDSKTAWIHGRWQEVQHYAFDESADFEAEGPCLIAHRSYAAYVPPGWEVQSDSSSGVMLERKLHKAPPTQAPSSTSIQLELYTNRLRGIAEEMGELLRRSAISTSIRERLDFSCAILDREGRLIVNAPHIPVHLGALGICVREVAKAMPLRPGDTVVTNHPAFGGSHLPDVTLITPVFTDSGNSELLGYVASRAHHAELGGERPGSMPPDSTLLINEGVVIPPSLIATGGKVDMESLRRILTESPYPTRALNHNLIDIQAALAANQLGLRQLQELASRYGKDEYLNLVGQLYSYAASEMRNAISELDTREFHARELMDDGTPLEFRGIVQGGSLHLNFEGSGGVHRGNLNMTPAVVSSALIYVLRLLVAGELPLNEALLQPVEIDLPQGILNPDYSGSLETLPALVGGNVETSQRLVGIMMKAFGIAASSQGTMNNLLFGNEHFSYYETIPGGSGASATSPGASAVQCHMTNTRITDPEVLEHRFPVRLNEFSIRRGSGGAGRHGGGNGTRRSLTFLQPVELSFLSEHRKTSPFGLEGGEPGASGSQSILRNDGASEPMSGKGKAQLAPGDTFIVETPGGGGFGRPISE